MFKSKRILTLFTKFTRSKQSNQLIKRQNVNSYSNFSSTKYIVPLLCTMAPFVFKNDDSNDDTKQLTQRQKYNFIANVTKASFASIVQVETLTMSHFEAMPSSAGSGFIVSSDGVILTNAHVIRDINNISVRLNDGRIFNGRVIKIDPVRDIAAIKIDCNDLKALNFESPDNIQSGEFVIALGSPLKLSDTVTFGIISNPKRMLLNKMDYVQTDVSVNVGNSGGPLINLDGYVVGMNTMSAASLSANMFSGTGISFAIPSSVLKSFCSEILNDIDKYSKMSIVGKNVNFIGVKLFPIDELSTDLFIKMGITGVSCGCFVANVLPNSPADKAGLRRGDVIIGINDKEVKDTLKVYEELEKDHRLKLTLIRHGKEINVEVTADQRIICLTQF